VSPFIAPFAAATPFGLAAGALKLRQWNRLRRKPRRPVSEKLLRSPGESTRQRIEKTDESIALALVALSCSAAFIFASLFPHPISGWLPTIIVGGCTALISSLLLSFWAFERRDASLGFSGERAVGEELNKLLAHGCRVFHDCQPEGTWNIDHIVVAPSGVYAVETKTRSKHPGPHQPNDYQVTYDGHGLHFPGFYDRDQVDQARRQAKNLAWILKDELGELVPVRPILALPGWHVVARVPDSTVQNPKNIHLVILKEGPVLLSPERIAQIADILDARCRTVEF
jgi:hypothetical protein